MTTPAESSICPKCGAALPPNAPHGLCPGCLLAGVDSPTEGGDPSVASAPSSDAPAVEQIAAAFPQLEILELIGRGGMSFVYKARQPGLDRTVALKLLPQRLAAQPGFRERFTREGRMLARLNHPSIVSVFDFGELGGYFYLLMEYVDGVNLRQAMSAGRFTLAQALTVVPKICDALSYAHGEGVLHRDIKPENILLDTRGRVKIADFGIAKLLGDLSTGERLTAHDAALGTPHYMAPEQIERPSEVDHRADIYSLGVVFYEMLTGELPLGHFAPPSERSPLDPRVDEVVMRALARERERRQQSAGEVKTQVETIAGTAPPVPAGRPGPPHPVLMRVPAWSGKAIASALLAVPAWAAVFVGLGLIFPFLAKQSGTGSPSLGIFVAAIPLFAPGLLAWFLGRHALQDPSVRDGSRRGAWLAAFGMMSLPTTLIQIGLMAFCGLILPAKIAMIAVLVAVPAAIALGLWLAARQHQRATGRSAAPWPQRFAWTFGIIYACLLLILVPVACYRAMEQPRVDRPMSRQAGLPQGAIELVAIAPHPSTAAAWWQPDGRIARQSEVGFINEGSHTYPGPEEHAFEFVFRTRDLPQGASLPTFRFDPAVSWAGGGAPASLGDPDKPLANHHLVAATFPKKVVRAQIRVGIATDRWENLVSVGPRGSVGTSRTYGGIPWSVSFGEALETKDGDIVVHVAHNSQPDWQTRVVAVPAGGDGIQSSRSSTQNEQTSYHFTKLTSGELKGFIFQVRPYQWTEFANVMLEPVAK